MNSLATANDNSSKHFPFPDMLLPILANGKHGTVWILLFIRFPISEKMTEELDLLGQDSDGDSEEVVLTPAELIDRLEQVNSPHRIPLLQVEPLYLVQLCRCQESK